jgi:hypothetical protein
MQSGKCRPLQVIYFSSLKIKSAFLFSRFSSKKLKTERYFLLLSDVYTYKYFKDLLPSFGRATAIFPSVGAA